MKLTQHTPEPWFYGIAGEPERGQVPFNYTGPGYYENGAIFSASGRQIAGCTEYDAFNQHDTFPGRALEQLDIERSANIQRIVACVNGCAGISDPETTVPELVAALKHARKKLAIAIELAGLEDDEKVSDYPVIKQIDDALSKVTL